MDGKTWSTLGLVAGIFGAVASGIGSTKKDAEYQAQRQAADEVYRQQLLERTNMIIDYRLAESQK